MKPSKKGTHTFFEILRGRRRKGVRPLFAACAVSVALASCVTINIYFPAAAAERAADRIIDEVWQLKPHQVKPASDKPGAAQ